MRRGRTSKRKREDKINVTLPLPICQECPWKIWCQKLNFRTRDPQGKEVKVCPVWWAVVEKLREKGILKARPPPSPLPISKEEIRILLDNARQDRLRKRGMAG
jgi:hypothetical protein